MTKVIITPFSTSDTAIAATINTFSALPGADFVHESTQDGKIYGHTRNASFMIWAATQQGYAQSVEIVTEVRRGR